MPRSEFRAGAVSLGLSLLVTAPALGQEPATDLAGIYRPDAPQQLPPLRVEVLDGRRFKDVETGTVYRLYGVDTCAPAQTARLGRQPWPCGAVATAWLVGATLNRWLSCAPVREEAGEQLARCASASHTDLATAMIRDGVAVTLPATDTDPAIRAYAAAELAARKSFRGLWASTFQMPWEFRTDVDRRGGPAAAREVRP